MQALLAVPHFHDSRKFGYLSPLLSKAWRSLCICERNSRHHLTAEFRVRGITGWLGQEGTSEFSSPASCPRRGQLGDQTRLPGTLVSPWKPSRVEIARPLRAPWACVTCHGVGAAWKWVFNAVKKFGSLIQSMEKKLRPSAFVVYSLSCIY